MLANPDHLLDHAEDIANPASQKLIDSLRGQPPLGIGVEKVVYDLGNGKVVAFTPHYGVEGLKRRYYTQKLLHLALPRNIPDAHLVGSKPPLMILDKVEPGEDTDWEARQDDIEELERELHAIGARSIDVSKGNFIRDVNGNMQYVDSLIFDSQPNGLLRVIKHLKEPETQKARYFAERAGIKIPHLPN